MYFCILLKIYNLFLPFNCDIQAQVTYICHCSCVIHMYVFCLKIFTDNICSLRFRAGIHFSLTAFNGFSKLSIYVCISISLLSSSVYTALYHSKLMFVLRDGCLNILCKSYIFLRHTSVDIFIFVGALMKISTYAESFTIKQRN